MALNPIAKVIIGAILMIGSVWWIATGSQQIIHRSGWEDLKTVLNGVIPALIFVIGIFVVWLEMDELRVEKELKTEERKARTRKKK